MIVSESKPGHAMFSELTIDRPRRVEMAQGSAPWMAPGLGAVEMARGSVPADRPARRARRRALRAT